MYEQTLLFKYGREGYRAFSTPVLVTTNTGAILAICEGRNSDPSVMGGDSGDIDIVYKKSNDNGCTWSPLRIMVRTGPDTDGNPCPIVDQDTGTIWLLFCKNFADGPEDLIIEGKAPRTVWITSSNDDGETWAEPTEITKQVKCPSWTWYATGPCHGIQLQNGRLIAPCDHVEGTASGYHDVESSIAVLSKLGRSHVVYSDDHGASWNIGAIAQAGSNESVAVETSDGGLYLNCRNYVGERRRAYGRSVDGGVTFVETGYHPDLPDPICQGSALRLTDEATHGKNRMVFSNAASSTKRERMTVRISYDEGQTWNAGKLLHNDHSGYSDLCITRDRVICCLFDRGKGRTYEGLALTRFDLEWLTDGEDTLN